ncbi:hypothetical protein M407DRAFT_243086 [Tulasnella calospora MUT 4182]|uniref:Uncharacterized protein n=1 Tax=Tulasnella calospora MUT 4182 TaxID=1051891 RepID=A0A0C3M3G7_9AGAM|nr:hypothetical protein M407DRAFT_243086 [Tulasnella calospora MUT 4182]
MVCEGYQLGPIYEGRWGFAIISRNKSELHSGYHLLPLSKRNGLRGHIKPIQDATIRSMWRQCRIEEGGTTS